jgi:predicted ATPase
MLQSISLRNFKGFKEIDSLKIKPITVLCGTNSSGKTSLLQSILLLKQTLESKNLNQTMLLNGRLAHLGTFENIIYCKDPANEVIFKFDFCITHSDSLFTGRYSRTAPIHFLLRELFSERSPNDNNTRYKISYEISLKLEPENIQKSRLKPIRVNKINVNTGIELSENNSIQGTEILLTHKQDNIYDVVCKNLPRQFPYRSPEEKKDKILETKIEFSNLFPIEFGMPRQESRDELRDIRFFFYRLNDAFQNIFSSFSYLGPLREEPSRRYIYEDEIIEIGIKGENAAFIYLSEKESLVRDHYFISPLLGEFEKRGNIKLGEALEEWLNHMKIIGLRAEPTNEIIRLNLNSNFSGKTRVNIADVGFGVSQIFPIILEGLRMPRRNTLILEQPEIHLHPSLQMKMADFLISLALSDKKVIVETHSDHIVNRLVRRIVEDENNLLNNLISIYFFNQSKSDTSFEEIQIDDKRGIINWPNDFFDQTASEQKKIIEAGINKRRSKKAGKNKNE